MSKFPDAQMSDLPPVVLSEHGQQAFEFVETTEYDIQVVGLTKNGFGLFRRKEGHGGYSYWTDQYGPFMVYDEGLTDVLSMFDALEHLGVGETMWKHIGEVFGYGKTKVDRE